MQPLAQHRPYFFQNLNISNQDNEESNVELVPLNNPSEETSNILRGLSYRLCKDGRFLNNQFLAASRIPSLNFSLKSTKISNQNFFLQSLEASQYPNFINNVSTTETLSNTTNSSSFLAISSHSNHPYNSIHNNDKHFLHTSPFLISPSSFQTNSLNVNYYNSPLSSTIPIHSHSQYSIYTTSSISHPSTSPNISTSLNFSSTYSNKDLQLIYKSEDLIDSSVISSPSNKHSITSSLLNKMKNISHSSHLHQTANRASSSPPSSSPTIFTHSLTNELNSPTLKNQSRRTHTFSYKELRSSAFRNSPMNKEDILQVDNRESNYGDLLQAKLKRRNDFLISSLQDIQNTDFYLQQLYQQEQHLDNAYTNRPNLPFLSINTICPNKFSENILIRPFYVNNACKTELEVERAYQIFSSPSKIVLIDKYDIEITSDHIMCLKPNQWLNDELINFYMAMLQEKNAKNILHNSKLFSYPKCFIFNTFFFEKLAPSNRSYNYQSVQRWTLRKKIDIFKYDILLIPINLSQAHWILGAIYMKPYEKEIALFDSLNGQNERFFKVIQQYLQDEYFDKKGNKLVNISDWKFPSDYSSRKGIPLQKNTSDCGVFLCQFAECISNSAPFNFSQDDIPSIRLKMALQIVQGHL